MIMKKFLVPVIYVVRGRAEIESTSIEKLRDDLQHGNVFIPLPNVEDTYYIDGSEELDMTREIIDVFTDEEYGW